MRNILLGIASFLMAFTVALWFFFPYQTFIDNIMKTIGANMKTDIKYESVQSGLFSTDYSGVKAGEREIGDISFSHSPLKLMQGQLGVTVRGAYDADAVVSRNYADFDVRTSGKSLDFITEPVKLNGGVHVKGTFDIVNDSADVTAELEKVTMKSPVGEMDFNNVTADVKSHNSTLDILSLRSDDKMGLDMQGTVHLDSDFITKSPVSLSGTMKMFGSKKHISLRGTMSNLHPEIN